MGKIIIERRWAGRNFAKASKTGDRTLFPIELEQAGIMRRRRAKRNTNAKRL